MMTPSNFEKLKLLLIELDGFLTTKPKQAQHMMVNQAETMLKELEDKGEYIYYLGDGGMSRIAIKLSPNYELFVNPALFPTYNSMQLVKDRWKLEEAQDLIGDIIDILFTPNEEMVARFKEQVSDKAELIDPYKEQDWYSMTIGWALANGLFPDNAIRFATHIRYNTNLG